MKAELHGAHEALPRVGKREISAWYPGGLSANHHLGVFLLKTLQHPPHLAAALWGSGGSFALSFHSPSFPVSGLLDATVSTESCAGEAALFQCMLNLRLA